MISGKISVIIPVYNVESYLDRCINSVVNQTYKNLEIILIDDGSEDNSGALCDLWKIKDERIVVIHTENNGVSCARNEGLDKAKGEFIAFVDADDWLEKDMYTLMVKNIQENDADICFGGHVLTTREKNIGVFQIKEPCTYVRDAAIQKIFSVDSLRMMGWELVDKLFRSNTIKECRFQAKCSVSEDKLFLWKVLKYSRRISYVSLNKYHYFMRKDSVVHNCSLKHILDDVFVSMELYKLSMQESADINKLMKIRYYMTLIASIRKMIIIKCDVGTQNLYIEKYIGEIRENLFFIMGSKCSFVYKLGAVYSCLPVSVMKILRCIVKNYKTRSDVY